MQTGTRPPVTADVTRQLARHIATSRYADRPAEAVAAARRPGVRTHRVPKKQTGIRELLRLCA